MDYRERGAGRAPLDSRGVPATRNGERERERDVGIHVAANYAPSSAR